MLDGATRWIQPLREPSEAYPSNSEAEQSLLGSIMRNNSALGAVRDYLKSEHFYYPAHVRVFEAMIHLNDRGVGISPVTLKGWFEQDSALYEIGGAAYLSQLAESAVTLINAPGYAATIVELAQRRQLMAAAEELHRRASRQVIDDPVSGQIEHFADQLAQIEQQTAFQESRKPYRGLADVTYEALDRAQMAYQQKGRLVGISTGLADLDKRILGWLPGNFYILGGRPSAGKSAALVTAIVAAARDGHGCYIWSGEMPGRIFANRLLAALTGISVAKQNSGDLSAAEWNDLINAQATLATWPVVIDDQSDVTPSILRTRIKSVHRKMPLGLVGIDYLQIMGGDRGDEAKETVPQASRGMRLLAKELDVPVVALSQVKRDVEARDDKRPHQADLLWSSALEQDGNVIITIFREEYYLAKSEPRRKPYEDDEKIAKRHAQWSAALEACRGKAELLIEKNRDGDFCGTVHARFDGARSLFEDAGAWERSERLW